MLNKMRKSNKEGLRLKSINLDDRTGNKKIPLLYDNLENCCGCSACFSICPRHAITMNSDLEGFLYPLIDADKCICCNQCIKVCAFKKDQIVNLK